MNITDCFENGTVNTLSGIISSKDIEFIPHAEFRGVSLKHLVTGNMTNNQISCHLVKIEPFCILDTHTHEMNLEIHEIIYGDGTCFIEGNEVPYKVGTISVIPSKSPHRVEAGANGMYILAKFTPSLI